MLIDDFREFRSGFVFPDGTKHDTEVAKYVRTLKNTRVFVLDRDAVHMSIHAGLSRPTSLLEALKFARPPFPDTWIEWSTVDSKEAMTDLGSPNVLLPRSVSGLHVKRVAIRLRMSADDPDVLQIDYVHEDVFDGRTMIDGAPVRGIFELATELPKHFDIERAKSIARRYDRDDVRKQLRD